MAEIPKSEAIFSWTAWKQVRCFKIQTTGKRPHLGVQYGIRLLLKSWLVYWQELYCDLRRLSNIEKLSRRLGCKECSDQHV